MISPIRFLTLAVLALGWMSTASAHHSNAAYDMDHLGTIEGTVKEVNWTNPHITFHVVRKTQRGRQTCGRMGFRSVKPRRADPFGLDKTLEPAGRSRHLTVCAASRWLGRSSCCK